MDGLEAMGGVGERADGKESNKNILFMYTLYTDFVDRILLHSVTHQFGDMTRKV